ncbi:MAG: hypothetical protein ACI9BW_000637 [Gammaproteobacteria bacterium]|jgi:hypothetical protein
MASIVESLPLNDAIITALVDRAGRTRGRLRLRLRLRGVLLGRCGVRRSDTESNWEHLLRKYLVGVRRVFGTVSRSFTIAS